MTGLLLLAAAAAFTQATPEFTAVDFAFRASGTDATSLTIAPGQTVSFSYPTGMSTHNVDFTGDRKPECTGLPPFPYPPRLWSTASCRFDEPGTYPFVCDLHAEMTGTVVVVAAPAPTPIPTPAPTPAPATPAPTPVARTLTLDVPALQKKGTRVRGSVAGSGRVRVTIRSGKARAGVWTKLLAGRTAFSIALDAKTRKQLRAKRRLKLTVTATLAGAHATAKTTVRL